MTPQPLVTVGIPAYNAERFIALSIRSVLNQTYKNIELIITDDGSTDKTVEIAHSFIDSRIRVISDGENQGISYRLNQQIGLANGEFFARMDADDVMLPDRIERQVEYLINHADVDAIGGGAVVIDDDNDIIGVRRQACETILDTERWAKGMTFIHPTVTGKLDFFKRYGYSDALKGVEDVDLWGRAANDAKMVILPYIYIFYREPLIFKLSTYLFRGRQFRKLIARKDIKDKLGQARFVCRLLGSYLRCFAATAIHLLRQDRLMISRRNSNVNDISRFQKIITNISVR